MQSWVNTLQRRAEDRDELDLSSPALDEWIPEPVLREYCAEVLDNCRELVKDLELPLHAALPAPTAAWAR